MHKHFNQVFFLFYFLVLYSTFVKAFNKCLVLRRKLVEEINFPVRYLVELKERKNLMGMLRFMVEMISNNYNILPRLS